MKNFNVGDVVYIKKSANVSYSKIFQDLQENNRPLIIMNIHDKNDGDEYEHVTVRLDDQNDFARHIRGIETIIPWCLSDYEIEFREDSRPKTKTCILCTQPYQGHGNNPEPLIWHKIGLCCDMCNLEKLYRLELHYQNRQNKPANIFFFIILIIKYF